MSFIIPQIQDEDLKSDLNDLFEFFTGKKLNEENNVIPNPFGDKDKIVLELETAKDGSKKLTHESEIVLGAIFAKENPILKNMSKHFLAYMAQNANSNMSDIAAKKQLFWIACKFNGATMSYVDSKKVFDDAFVLFKQVHKLLETESELIEEASLNKIIIQFLLALENTTILNKIKNVLIKLVTQDDDLKAQWEAIKIIPDPASTQSEQKAAVVIPVQENITDQILNAQPVDEIPEDTDNTASEKSTEQQETTQPSKPTHQSVPKTKSNTKHASKNSKVIDNNNQAGFEALIGEAVEVQ